MFTTKNFYFALSFITLVLGAISLAIRNHALAAACFSLAAYCRIGHHHAA